MIKRKSILALMLSSLLAVSAFAGCSAKSTQDTSSTGKNSVSNQSSTGNGGNANTTAGKKRVFRVGLFNPESHPMSQGVKEFGKILAQKSNGSMELEIYYGGQLGDKPTHYQSLQTGVLDISIAPVGVIADYGASKLSVYTLPYLFKSVKQARNAQSSEVGLMLLDHIQKSGTKMVGLGMYQESARNYFFTKKRVTNIKDLKGLKIRCQEGSIYFETMKTFGASPVSVAFTELYSAVQTGIVDGAEQPLSGFTTNHYQEVSKYYLMDGHELSPNVLLMSEMTWNSLSADDQKLLRKCFNESSEFFNKLSDEKDSEYLKTIKAAGVEILQPDNPAEWQEAVKGIYEKYAAKYADIIKDLQNVPN